MKLFKKLTSILLAMAMMLAMGAAAFAANEPVSGEEYKAYKIFDATIKSENQASYSIANDSAWLTDVQAYANTSSNGLTLTQTADNTGYLVTIDENSFDAGAFAAYLKTKTSGKTENGKGTATKVEGANTGTVSITGLEDGYYLVTSSLGAVCQLTTAGTLTVVEKNTIPNVEKTTDTNSAYAAIGDKIPYTITITDGTGTNKAITLHDQMSTGLTFNSDIEIKVNGTAVGASNYTLKTGTEAGNDTFNIVFNDDYIASLNAGDKIVVTYSATVNKDAINVNQMTNTASIDYSNQSNTDTSTVTTKTNSFQVKKYAANDSNKANLAGATFKLTDDNNTVIKLIKIDDTNYRVAEENEENSVETFTTVDSGNITIKGVDSDKTYKLVETVAPNGYNLLTGPVTVGGENGISAENTTIEEVPNSAGQTLPTTGGMGTTLLYTVGALLVLGAGVTLVVRRRMNAAK